MSYVMLRYSEASGATNFQRRSFGVPQDDTLTCERAMLESISLASFTQPSLPQACSADSDCPITSVNSSATAHTATRADSD